VYPLVCPEHREAFQALVGDVFGGRTGTLEFRMVGLKGRPLWLFTHAAPLRDAAGQVVAALAVTIDITARKEAEEQLRESERLVRNILDTVDEGFIVVDRDYRIQVANRAYCDQLGGCAEEVVGRHCYEVSHRVSQPCAEHGEECAVRRVFETGRTHTALHRHVDGRGELLHVETKAFPITDASGEVVSAIETVNNITERHLLEDERLKTQKLEAIGTLAGGIAHDFNNLLQGVFGYISLAKMNLERKERSLAMLEQAEEALQISVNLTTQLLTFSKGGKPVKRRIRLGPVIENAAKFALSGSRSDCRLLLDETLRIVEVDPGQLGQVIQNIVLNADQAMPEGGSVEISSRNLRAPGPGVPPQLGAGDYVAIAIRDNGIGVPEKHLRRIFDPYFPTKERGSGLGLATSYSIVRNHGGLIDVASLPGCGTTFTVYLPALEAAADAASAPVAPEEPARRGSILVMDDEPLVLQVAAEQIRSLGHDVELAADGAAAVEKYRIARESGRSFDAVILDLTVRGGLGGSETLARLLAVDPDVKAIISSGYSDDAVIADHRRHGFAGRLTKPYAIEHLRAALAPLLS
jgi:PAS domain S-box-containing protein